MSVVSLSSSRTFPESELQQIAQLAVAVSGRLAQDLENIAPAIAEALEQVAAATRVGRRPALSEKGLVRWLS